MKIRAYLALMALAILIPVTVFSGIWLKTLLDAERESALRGARETVRASMLKADRDLSNAHATLRALSTATTLANQNWAMFHEQAKQSTAGSGSWILVLDENGQQLLNTVVPYGSPLPPPQAKQRVQEVLQLNKPVISNLILGPLTRKYVVVVDYPVTLANGKRLVLSQSFFV